MGFPSAITREAGTSQPATRRVRRRLSSSHLLIGVVALLAFALNYVALRDREATTMVAVADRPFAAGEEVVPADVVWVPLPSDFTGVESLLDEDELLLREGWILSASVPAGGVIAETMVVEPAAPSGLRAMSIPIEVEHAAGGGLVPGDSVDVISTAGDEAAYVARGVEVLAVADRGSASFGALGAFHVVVAVDAEQALLLAEAIHGGAIEVVRSTGASQAAGDGG